MTGCTFHDADSLSRERRMFEIVERAYAQREKVVVYALNRERAAAIDRILWINKQESFIPHEILDEDGTGSELAVVIVTGEFNPIGAPILVADGHCSLDFAGGFEAVHEFVDRSSPEKHEASRDRFRAYRARQIPVEYAK
jgi:DNA polymerase-3 subunit chi